jgi:hypothetical protein
MVAAALTAARVEEAVVALVQGASGLAPLPAASIQPGWPVKASSAKPCCSPR